MNYIKKAYARKKAKNWPKLYVCVDLHETVITPTYNKMNVGAVLYPGAQEVLARWTALPDVCLILWTPSHPEAADAIRELLAEKKIVFDYWNKNPEQPSGELCDFSEKFYFDICLEDKAGFEAETDWLRIKETLIELDEWEKTDKIAT